MQNGAEGPNRGYRIRTRKRKIENIQLAGATKSTLFGVRKNKKISIKPRFG